MSNDNDDVSFVKELPAEILMQAMMEMISNWAMREYDMEGLDVLVEEGDVEGEMFIEIVSVDDFVVPEPKPKRKSDGNVVSMFEHEPHEKEKPIATRAKFIQRMKDVLNLESKDVTKLEAFLDNIKEFYQFDDEQEGDDGD